MRRAAALLLVFLALALAYPAGQSGGPAIRLVLLIAVDQFRYDYLTRFRADYTSGLKRFLTNGAVFTNAHLEHYPTVTAVAHATMLSGAKPSVSGIIGNDWFDRATGASVASISDNTVSPLGAPSGAASPRRLLVSTLGDELKLAAAQPKTSPNAPRVFGVSLKDRSAILPVGRSANAAFWWDTKTGAFITSTYYLPALPEWVQQFNAKHPADAFANTAWTALTDPTAVLRKIPALGAEDYYETVYGSPHGNQLVLDFAMALLEKEQLGLRNATDLLSVSFSSNDSVGHTYGPESPQVRDISIRTDRTIGALLERVEKTVGLDRTLVAFTSDHGVGGMPEALRDQGIASGRTTTATLTEAAQQALVARFGDGKWILSTAGSSMYFDYKLIASRGIDPTALRDIAARAVAGVPHVARVYTRDQLQLGQVHRDRIGQRVLDGFNLQRSGDLEVILEPNWIRQATGTTHGTPYNYDSHIPLVLMGSRVRAGEYAADAALNDLAPTLATLIGVAAPDGSSGRVLVEALRAQAEPAPRPGSR